MSEPIQTHNRLLSKAAVNPLQTAPTDLPNAQTVLSRCDLTIGLCEAINEATAQNLTSLSQRIEAIAELAFPESIGNYHQNASAMVSILPAEYHPASLQLNQEWCSRLASLKDTAQSAHMPLTLAAIERLLSQASIAD